MWDAQADQEPAADDAGAIAVARRLAVLPVVVIAVGLWAGTSLRTYLALLTVSAAAGAAMGILTVRSARARFAVGLPSGAPDETGGSLSRRQRLTLWALGGWYGLVVLSRVDPADGVRARVYLVWGPTVGTFGPVVLLGTRAAIRAIRRRRRRRRGAVIWPR